MGTIETPKRYRPSRSWPAHAVQGLDSRHTPDHCQARLWACATGLPGLPPQSVCGVGASHHQGRIDWPSVASVGVNVVYASRHGYQILMGKTRSAVSERHNRIVESNAWNGKPDSLAAESLAREVFGRAAADVPRPVETLGTYNAQRIVVSLFQGILVSAFIIPMLALILRCIIQINNTKISRESEVTEI